MSVNVVSFRSGERRAITGCLGIPAVASGPGLVMMEDSGAEAGRLLADLYAAEGYVTLCLQTPASSEDQRWAESAPADINRIDAAIPLPTC